GQLGPSSAGSSVCVGAQAGLSSNNSTIHHVYVGNNAGKYPQTTAHDNVAVGFGALTGVNSAGNTASNNCAMGSGSMVAVNAGNSNVAIGNNSLPVLSSGSNNVALGDSVCPALTSATQTVAIGNGSGNK